MSAPDLSTFAKVRALHDSTTSPGEKAAAAGRMEALAKAAGMTVAEATSKLDAPPPPSRGGGFADFFDSPYFREQMAERERERATRWREVLEEYGTEEAVFEPIPWEVALEQACAPFVVRETGGAWRKGSLNGWCFVTSREDPAPEIVDAIANAFPMPATVRDAWVEFMHWDKLGRDREARGSGCGDHPDWVYFRVQLVERLLNALPAAGLVDLRARMDWMDWRNDLETAPDPDEERIRLKTLRADIERMGVQIRQARTSDERRTMSAGDNMGISHILRSPDLGSSNAPAEVIEETPTPSHAADAMASRPAVLKTVGATDPTKSGLSDTVQSGQAEGYSPSEYPQGWAPSAYPSRRTNADKRRDVRALLQVKPGNSGFAPLSDREIARRASVSPQTVGNLRRSHNAHP